MKKIDIFELEKKVEEFKKGIGEVSGNVANRPVEDPATTIMPQRITPSQPVSGTLEGQYTAETSISDTSITQTKAVAGNENGGTITSAIKSEILSTLKSEIQNIVKEVIRNELSKFEFSESQKEFIREEKGKAEARLFEPPSPPDNPPRILKSKLIKEEKEKEDEEEEDDLDKLLDEIISKLEEAVEKEEKEEETKKSENEEKDKIADEIEDVKDELKDVADEIEDVEKEVKETKKSIENIEKYLEKIVDFMHKWFETIYSEIKSQKIEKAEIQKDVNERKAQFTKTEYTIDETLDKNKVLDVLEKMAIEGEIGVEVLNQFEIRGYLPEHIKNKVLQRLQKIN